MDEIEMLETEIDFLEYEEVKLSKIRKIINDCIINTNVHDNNFNRLTAIQERLDNVKDDIEIMRTAISKIDLLYRK